MLRLFWQNQFVLQFTRGQVVFDVFFGIIMPFVCLGFDPIIFAGGRGDRPPLGTTYWRVFAISAILLECMALAVWLSWRNGRPRLAAVFDVAFLIGGLAALGLGLFLFLPALFAALLGFENLVASDYKDVPLFLGIAFLCLVPLLVSFTYIRNSRRALAVARRHVSSPIWMRSALSGVTGLAMVFGPPIVLQVLTSEYVDSRVRTIVTGSRIDGEVAVNELKGAFWCTSACYWEIAVVYRSETDAARKSALSTAYLELVGIDPSERPWGDSD